MPDVDFLGDAAALLGGEGAACLGFELEFVALCEEEAKVSFFKCKMKRKDEKKINEPL